MRKATVVVREEKGNPFKGREVCRAHADEMVASGFFYEAGAVGEVGVNL